MNNEKLNKKGGPKTFVIANQKGGVGKTVTSMGLAQLLAERGYVLAIDLDPQGNLTDALGGNKSAENDLFDVLTQNTDNILPEEFLVGKALQRTNFERIHLLPGTLHLSQFEKYTGEMGYYSWLLEKAIEPLSYLEYDYIVIDTPPALGGLTTTALTACKNGGVIIPAFPDRFSASGIVEILKTIQKTKRHVNSDLNVLGVLVTNHNPQTNLGQAYIDEFKEIAEGAGTKVLSTYIRRNIKLAEAAAFSESIAGEEYRKSAPKLYEDYTNLLEELLQEVEKGETVYE